MIEICRSLVRQIRTVFRKAAPRIPVSPLQVTFQAGKDGLAVRLHRNEILVQYHLAGEFSDEEITLPMNALADCEGKTQALVIFETAEPGTIQARWDDAGVPQVRNYTAEGSVMLSEYPAFPEKMVSMDNGFLEALAEATRSADQQPIRYAVNQLQLQGRGAIVATDGRQLLLQRSFSFPWAENVLVPASPVYFCRELWQHPVAIGKSDAHVTIQAGPWTLHLPIDKEGRFPDVTRVIPRKEVATAHCRLPFEDRQFLARAIARLPGGETSSFLAGKTSVPLAGWPIACSASSRGANSPIPREPLSAWRKSCAASWSPACRTCWPAWT